jgi:hypothetical protein
VLLALGLQPAALLLLLLLVVFDLLSCSLPQGLRHC